MTLIQHWGMSLQVSDLITYLPHHRCVLQFGVSLLGCTDARMPEHLCHSLHAHAMVEEQHAACTAAPMRSDRLVYPRSLGDHFQPLLYCWLLKRGNCPWYFLTIARASGNSTAQYSMPVL